MSRWRGLVIHKAEPPQVAQTSAGAWGASRGGTYSCVGPLDETPTGATETVAFPGVRRGVAARRQTAAILFLASRIPLGTLSPMRSPPVTPQPPQHHLSRLAPESYRAFAVVHWTITLERRATGWLNDSFHAHFRELLLHASAREGLFCPAYVLMPDHMHLIWMGLRVNSDQRNAMKFLRKHLATELARRSPTGVEFELQKQSHDSVLREQDRVRGAFAKACFYVLDNPRRADLVKHPREWKYLGAVVPGYPFMHPLGEDFWELFWKLYEQHREPAPKEP